MISAQRRDKIRCALGRFTLGSFYTDNTLYTILPNSPRVNLKYLLALFNSRLLNFVYHFVSQEAGKSQAQVKVAVVRKLPAVVSSEEVQRPIIALVDKILSAKGADTSELERTLISTSTHCMGLPRRRFAL